MSPVRWADGLKDLMVPITRVQQHPDNANNGDLDSIIESIKINGYNSPIIVERATGYIVAGNHRYQALHALGATQVPVIWTDMTREQALRYMVADNRTGQKAVTDDALMIEILNQLQETDTGLFGTGYTEDELTNLILSQDQAPLPEVPQGGMGIALNGIYEVTVAFDNEGDRDALAGEMRSRYGDDEVREANL